VELLIECHREGRNQDGKLIARAILFDVDPDNCCKTINEIAEVEVIVDPAHCYNLRHLAKVVTRWVGNEPLTFMNKGLTFGRATATGTKARMALVQVVQRWQQTGSTQPPPPPPRQPEPAQMRWLTDDEWLMVLASRGEL